MLEFRTWWPQDLSLQYCHVSVCFETPLPWRLLSFCAIVYTRARQRCKKEVRAGQDASYFARSEGDVGVGQDLEDS